MRAPTLATRAGRALLVAWFLAPLLPLLLWAGANRWTYPALLPQRWGGAGWVAALDSGAPAAFARSAVLGLVVAAIATPAGAMAARALTLGRVRWPRLVSAVLLAPVALPPFAVVKPNRVPTFTPSRSMIRSSMSCSKSAQMSTRWNSMARAMAAAFKPNNLRNVFVIMRASLMFI